MWGMAAAMPCISCGKLYEDMLYLGQQIENFRGKQ